MTESQRKNTESQRKIHDMEKVIKGLYEAARVIDDHVPVRYVGYAEQACWDALALLRDLREQESEIVRCKDCKHYDPDTQSCNDELDGIFLPDWFCADGERR